MKKKALLSAIAATMLLVAFPAMAAEILQPTAGNGNVAVGLTETHKNLYTAGGNVTVDGKTMGDLTAAGGMLVVSGDVEQEALLAGGNIQLSGSVGSTARIAGGNITISGPIGGDLVVAGGNVTLTGKASVAGDLLIAGGNVIIEAPVKGDVRVAGGNVTINSKVGGAVHARTTQSLIFGPAADVGQVDYKGPQAASVQQGAKVGNVNFTEVKTKNFGASFGALLTLGFLIKLLAWIAAGLVLVYLRKNFVLSVYEEFKAKPWGNLGIGLLALVGTPILVVLLLVTFIGYYLAFTLGLIYVLALALANLMSALVLGYWLLSKMNKPGEPAVDWQAIVIGAVIWSLLGFIPILGWLAMAIVFLMVLGAAAKKVKAGVLQH